MEYQEEWTKNRTAILSGALTDEDFRAAYSRQENIAESMIKAKGMKNQKLAMVEEILCDYVEGGSSEALLDAAHRLVHSARTIFE